MVAVKPISNLRTIMSAPMRKRIGLFLDEPLDCLKLRSVVDSVRDPDGNGTIPPTVIVPTHPVSIREPRTGYDDLVYDDPRSRTTRILYQGSLRGPIQGIHWITNRAVILPTYLYEEGAAPYFDICFVFCEQEVGEEVIARKEQLGTETLFISLTDLRFDTTYNRKEF